MNLKVGNDLASLLMGGLDIALTSFSFLLFSFFLSFTYIDSSV